MSKPHKDDCTGACSHIEVQSVDNSELDSELVDLVDEHFPKGKCKERGQAMVMLSCFLKWHKGQVEQVETAAFIRGQRDMYAKVLNNLPEEDFELLLQKLEERDHKSKPERNSQS